jgi:membrane protein
MRASNTIYEVEEGRSFVKLRPLQMLVTLVLVMLVALILLALVVTGSVARKIELHRCQHCRGDRLGLRQMPVVVAFMIAVLYYAAPNDKLRGFTSVMPGVEDHGWRHGMARGIGFASYVANFGCYNKTYGALGAVIVLLVWLWITNVAILPGGEINAERERARQLKERIAGAERELHSRSAPNRNR